MPLSCNGRRRFDCMPRNVAMKEVLLELDIAMRSAWCYCQKEWLLRRDGIIKEAISFTCQNIGRILTLMADRWVLIPLEAGVEILIRMRVEEEIGAGKARREGRVIIAQ